MAMAARVVLVATVAWVAMEPLASMVRCLVIQELLAEWVATAVQVDWLDSADWQAALERQLARMVLKATAATRASVGQVATVPLERMGRFRLQTVKPAAMVARAERAA
jgi:hypothetical protein